LLIISAGCSPRGITWRPPPMVPSTAAYTDCQAIPTAPDVQLHKRRHRRHRHPSSRCARPGAASISTSGKTGVLHHYLVAATTVIQHCRRRLARLKLLVRIQLAANPDPTLQEGDGGYRWIRRISGRKLEDPLRPRAAKGRYATTAVSSSLPPREL
jgi:hypothetical protein